jgi:hypothetical protein
MAGDWRRRVAVDSAVTNFRPRFCPASSPGDATVSETVAEEEFSPAPLDYFNMMDAADAAAVKKGYLSCLHRAGLSCSEHNLSLLTQALYPVDATAENMKILAGNCTELAAMKVPGD